MDSILTVKNLAVRLEGELLIHDVNFELARGESIGVVGPNGAGKTVLLKSLLGLLPHEGSMVWAKDVRVGYVPQRVELDRHSPLNASDLFTAKCRVQKISETKIAETLQKANIPETIAHIPLGHLSGGQLQKILIALALLGDPTALFFDEPTANLDEPSEGHMYELIHRLEDEHIAVVVVSHDLEVITSYAEKILCINHRQISFGPSEEALTPKVLEQLYGASHKHYHAMSEKDMQP